MPAIQWFSGSSLKKNLQIGFVEILVQLSAEIIHPIRSSRSPAQIPVADVTGYLLIQRELGSQCTALTGTCFDT